MKNKFKNFFLLLFCAAAFAAAPVSAQTGAVTASEVGLLCFDGKGGEACFERELE